MPGQFNVGQHALMPASTQERLVHKLNTFTAQHRLASSNNVA